MQPSMPIKNLYDIGASKMCTGMEPTTLLLLAMLCSLRYRNILQICMDFLLDVTSKIIAQAPTSQIYIYVHSFNREAIIKCVAIGGALRK